MLEILEFILLITLGLINLSVWIYFSNKSSLNNNNSFVNISIL